MWPVALIRCLPAGSSGDGCDLVDGGPGQDFLSGGRHFDVCAGGLPYRFRRGDRTDGTCERAIGIPHGVHESESMWGRPFWQCGRLPKALR